jgi:Kef-type K+ transport system membrane component KefB
MTHEMTLLVLQLAVILITAKLLGFLFERFLRQPRVLGELAAGMIIGPYALGSLTLPVLNQPLFELAPGTIPVTPELYGFAIVASIVLLFLAGLETDLPTFLRFAGVGTVVGLGGVVASFALGAFGAWAFLPGVTTMLDPAALFLGTLSTATSVGITARILSEQRKMSSPEGVTILAAAVLDDVVGIILVAVVVGIARSGGGNAGVDWGAVGVIAARAFAFWLGFTIVGIVVAPRLTRGLKRFHSLEMVSGVAFGLALLLSGLSEMAGLAMIIGAYVTGLALSQTDVAHEIREQMQGVYNFLVPIFFCVMGMLVNFAALGSVFVFGLLFTLLAIVGKFVGTGVPALLSGFTLRGALRIGAGMQPRGEVTLIVAGIGLSAGAIGQDLFGVAIMTLLISTVFAPPLLVAVFQGGSGYRRETKAGVTKGPVVQIRLPLPGVLTADFLRSRIIAAFRSEEFFVNRIDFVKRIYRIRQDEISLTLRQEDATIEVTTSPEHEQFVRLLILEEMVDLTDLMESLKKVQNPETLGQTLVEGLFDEDADPPPGAADPDAN